MNSSPPLVSVITPVYNAEKFLAKTIESVQAQTHSHWEYLMVIDNNSRDRSQEIAEEHAKRDPRIRVITDPRAYGAAGNRNVGLDIAQGEYFAFIDADDLWLPRKLELQLKFMREKQSSFSFTAFTRISEDGNQTGSEMQVPSEVRHQDLLHDNSIGCLTAMVKREACQGLYFCQTGWEDMGLWLQVLKRVGVGHGLNESLAWYRIVNGSRSNNKLFAAKLRWQTLRDVEKMSLPLAAYYFSSYALSGIKKHLRF